MYAKKKHFHSIPQKQNITHIKNIGVIISPKKIVCSVHGTYVILFMWYIDTISMII